MIDFKHYLAMYIVSAAFYLIPLLKWLAGIGDRTAFNYLVAGYLFDKERRLPIRLLRLLLNLTIIWLVLFLYEVTSGRRLPLDWLI